MPAIWTLRSYVSTNREVEVESWYESQRPEVQAAFDARLEHLRQIPADQWREPLTKVLQGECDGLIEIRFKANRVQYRPLGFFGPERREFTILFCAVERGDQFEPHNACAIALWRKNDVLTRAEASVSFLVPFEVEQQT